MVGISAVGGESAALSFSQGTVYKTNNDVSLSTYNCYSQTDAPNTPIASYAISEADISGGDLTTLKGLVSVSTGAKSAGTNSFVSDSTKLVTRAQSTKDNGSGAKCTLQPPVTSGIYSNKNYQVTASAADQSIAAASSCQGGDLTYSVSVTGEATLPSWIESLPTGALNIKPSQITTEAALKTYTVNVAISDSAFVPNTVTSTFQVAFTNAAPTVANAMTAQTMYQGMGAHTITVPANTFADADTFTVSVANDLSGVTPKTFTLTGTTLNIELPVTYKGTFKVTLTATDYLGQTVTNRFDVTVEECTQTGCVECTGLGKAECKKCKTGYNLAAGACNLIPPPVVSETTTPTSKGNTYLNRTYDEVSPEGVGAPVFGATALAVGVGFATGSAPVIAGLGIGQCQMVQVMSLFNMNVPDRYVDYSLSYEITKIDIKFVDFIDLQDSLATGTRRNLGSGYTSLSNIGFHSGNFFVNYCYYFLLMIILVLVHLVVIGIVSMN